MNLFLVFRPLLETGESGPSLLNIEFTVLILLLVITLVALFVRVRSIKLPYTVALVLVGLGLAVLGENGLFPGLSSIDINQELILAIFVSPLVFEAALNLSWKALKKDMLPIFLLAVPGVLVGTFIVGNIVSRQLEIPIALAYAFGTLISATDPVAVVAFFRSLGVSERLNVLVEGESLFNDGVAIVVFGIATGMASSTGSEEALTGADIFLEFIRVGGGGLLIGTLLGLAVNYLLIRVDDNLIETTATLALAFGSFVVAELPGIHVSGILAVVASGIVVGSFGLHKISPTTLISLENFWEFMSFIANSLLFLLLGLKINVIELFSAEILIAILLAGTAVLGSRLIVVYIMGWISGLLGNPIPMSYRHVMFWGGLRGAVSMALALSLVDSPDGDKLRLMTYGVILVSLLLQGLTIERLIKILDLSNKNSDVTAQRNLADLFVARREVRTLDRLRSTGQVTDEIYNALFDVSLNKESDLVEEHPELELTLIIETRKELLRTSRVALSEIYRRKIITEDLYEEKLRNLDRRILVWETIERSFQESSSPEE